MLCSLDETEQHLVRRNWTAVPRDVEDWFFVLACKIHRSLQASRQDGGNGKDHRASRDLEQEYSGLGDGGAVAPGTRRRWNRSERAQKRHRVISTRSAGIA